MGRVAASVGSWGTRPPHLLHRACSLPAGCLLSVACRCPWDRGTGMQRRWPWGSSGLQDTHSLPPRMYLPGRRNWKGRGRGELWAHGPVGADLPACISRSWGGYMTSVAARDPVTPAGTAEPRGARQGQRPKFPHLGHSSSSGTWQSCARWGRASDSPLRTGLTVVLGSEFTVGARRAGLGSGSAWGAEMPWKGSEESP